ncbi:hypothetical protein, partial [Mesorhizobium sp.]|uniref:hypothetical protein n=1 Tax=Mesorhizobium sp. TaxID=1871066 RepID=UPI0025EEEA43
MKRMTNTRPEETLMADIGVSGDERRRSVRPLRALFPYVMQYRKLAVGAIISLIVAAGTTLA